MKYIYIYKYTLWFMFCYIKIKYSLYFKRINSTSYFEIKISLFLYDLIITISYSEVLIILLFGGCKPCKALYNFLLNISSFCLTTFQDTYPQNPLSTTYSSHPTPSNAILSQKIFILSPPPVDGFYFGELFFFG